MSGVPSISVRDAATELEARRESARGGAGAAAECTAALLLNPYDPETVATSIAHALAMPLKERRSRHAALFHLISENDLKTWGELFLAALTQNADVPLWREHLGLQPSISSNLA